MAIRNESVALDIRRTGIPASNRIVVTEHDRGATISITITEGGVPVELSDVTAVLRASAPGGYVEDPVALSGAIGTYTLSAELTSKPGTCYPYIALLRDDTVVCSTESFELKIGKAADLSLGEAQALQREFDRLKGEWETQMGAQEDEFNAKEEIRDEQEESRVTAEQGRVSAESKRVTAENGRVSAESKRATAENGRVSAENTRVSQENTRKSQEDARKSAEDTRKSQETSRQNAESARATAESNRAKAETARASAEDSRADAESKRVTAEQGRVSAESKRVTAESSRATEEGKRATAESGRASAESTRVSNEDARKSAESSRATSEEGRVSAESIRVSQEDTRKSQETARVNAESARATAETKRAEDQEKNNADQALNNEAARNNQPVVLASGQYDPDTLAPTISDPIPGRLYLVPLMQTKAAELANSIQGVVDDTHNDALAIISAAATGADNAYIEWLYINNKWEQLGVSQKQVTPIATDDIDKVAQSQTVEGENVLNLTGLSYLWSKIKAAFAAVGHKHSAADITSGTLPISRGGTGATSAAAVLTGLGVTATAAELNKLDGITATTAELNKMHGVTATTAELNYTDGVTSNIQTQLNGKAASSHTHAASQVTGLTASRALVSDANGHPAVSAVTNTELGYLDGVTSAIQTQINGKAASSHNHSAANITSGTLPVARGGTGVTASPSLLVNLASTSAAGVFTASPRPGVTGTLPLANGGTGATSASAARTSLGVSVYNTNTAFLAAHPVGSYYEENTGKNPGKTYGGTWTNVPSIGAFTWQRTA